MRLACVSFLLPAVAVAQTDTARSDSVYTLPPMASVARTNLPVGRLPGAIDVVSAAVLLQFRPALALDEALGGVPGVFIANRWNFSLDQRVSIRGFGARSQFGIRGVKVLLDGIPQTLPDGTGQLTNVELTAADAIEVLRGPGSALYGNATGGVISIRSREMTAVPFRRIQQDARLVSGPLYSKWNTTSFLRLGTGALALTASRMRFHGERQHSAADFRNVNARYTADLGRMHLAAHASVGDDPVADNPGALTAAELAANRDSAAAINMTRDAGKDVRQLQGGVSLRGGIGGNASFEVALFGVDRRLRNPQTFAYIGIDRTAYGARASLQTRLPLPTRNGLTLGVDLQRQRDDRTNVGNNGGQPDTVRQLDQLERITEVGPFALAQVDLHERLTMSIGGRYDRVTFQVDDRLVNGGNPDDSGRRTMSAASGTLGLAFALPSGGTAYVNAGTSFETPTTTELTNRPDTAGGFNASLRPQQSAGIEAGVRGTVWRSAGLLWWLHGSLALYRAHVRDALISYQIPSSPGRVFFQNAGRTRHQGIEASLALNPLLRVSYTHSDFRYRSYTVRGHVLDGRRVPGIPAHQLQATWSFRPYASAGGPWLEVQHTHTANVLVDDTLDIRSAGWSTADVRAGWHGAIGNVRLAPFIGVSNVFDKAYVGSVVINAANGRYYEPAPGRHWHIGMAVRFGS